MRQAIAWDAKARSVCLCLCVCVCVCVCMYRYIDIYIVLVEEFDECNEEWHAIRTPLQVTEVSRVSVTEVSGGVARVGN